MGAYESMLSARGSKKIRPCFGHVFLVLKLLVVVFFFFFFLRLVLFGF